jgi:hypothetical protein
VKIKLSKLQWQALGKKAGWVKAAQGMSMTDRMERFFSPSIRLVRRKLGGKPVKGYWYVDLVKDLPYARQFMDEAGIRKKELGVRIADSDLDAFGDAAGTHGFSVETIGD